MAKTSQVRAGIFGAAAKLSAVRGLIGPVPPCGSTPADDPLGDMGVPDYLHDHQVLPDDDFALEVFRHRLAPGVVADADAVDRRNEM